MYVTSDLDPAITEKLGGPSWYATVLNGAIVSLACIATGFVVAPDRGKAKSIVLIPLSFVALLLLSNVLTGNGKSVLYAIGMIIPIALIACVPMNPLPKD